ncbi:MAG: twin-arginine translocase subunit TatB [Chrysiogenetes bacterium]|nr:twin-arginine translocase subunit TatB [Chrysiogenetes bacterium]
MLSLGGGELILIGVLAIVLIGPEKLPDAARWLGKTWGGMRRALDDVTGEFRRELHQVDEEVRQVSRAALDQNKAQPKTPEEPADPGEVTADADLADFIGEVTGTSEESEDPASK